MAIDLATLALQVKSDGVSRATTALSDLERQARSTDNAANRLENSFYSVGKAVAGALAGFTLVGKAEEAVMMAARYETLGVVIAQAGKNAHYAAYEMAGFEKALQASGIAMQESRQVLTTLTTAQIDLSHASKLARAAQDLAVVGNINSSEAFQRLVHGITTAEVEILRGIGLNVSFEDSYKKLAQQLGKNVAALTTQEKTQARVNIALEQASKYMGIYEASMETAGKQLSSLPRYFQNISTLVGEIGLDAFSHSIMTVTAVAKEAEKALQGMRESGELADIGESVGNAFKFLTSNIDLAVVTLGVWALLTKGIPALTQAVTASITSQVGAKQVLLQAELREAQVLAAKKAVEVERARNIVAVTGGTITQTRAVNMLRVAEQQLVTADNTLAASQAKLAASMALSGRAATVATGAFAGLRTVGGGVLAMLGGPWGVAILGAAAALYSLSEAVRDGSQAMEEGQSKISDYMKRLEDATTLSDNARRQAWETAVRNVKRDIADSESAIQSLTDQLSEYYADTDSVFLPRTQGTFNVGAIQREMLAAVQAAETFEEKVIAVNEGISRLQDVKGFGATTAAGIAAKAATDLLSELEKLEKKQRELKDLGTDDSQASTARATAKATEDLRQQWEKFDNLVKQHSASKVVAGDVSSAAAYAYEFMKSTQHGADEQTRLKNEAIETALSTLEAALAAERLALSVASAVGPAADLGERLARIASLESFITGIEKGKESGPKTTRTGGGSSGNSARASAQKQLSQINIEIDKMLGIDTSQLELDKKLSEIGDTAKKAGQSAEEFQRKYKEAFEAQRARELAKELNAVEIELLNLEGRTKEAGFLELQAQLAETEEKLKQLGAPAEVVASTLERMKAATEKSSQVEDLEAAASFMQELSGLSGDYGSSVEYTNQLLSIQAEIYKQQLPEALHGYIAEWERLQKLQVATDWVSGLQRGFLEVGKGAQNMGQVMQDAVTQSAGIMSSSLSSFVLDGKNDFNDLVNSILSDLAQMAIQIASNQIISSIFSGIGGMFGSVFGGGSSGGSSNIFSSSASSLGGYASGFHSGGIAGGTPTFTRAVPMSFFDNALKYHTGGIAGNEIPAILQRGEGIFTQEQMRNLAPVGNYGGGTVINVQPVVVDRTQKGVAVTQQQTTDSSGNLRIETLIDDIDSALAGKVETGRSYLGNAFQKSYGVSRASAVMRK